MQKKFQKSKIFRFLRQYRTSLYFLVILIVGLYFRSFNINWDNNFYFHPDERAIVMFTIPIQLPESLEQFLSPQSPLNPKFFAYGNFPIYLLKSLGFIFSFVDPQYAEYGGIHIIGRIISIIADAGTLILVFLIGSLLFSRKAALLAMFLYASSVFPIQLSHFYAVDTMLTFFMYAFLYTFLLFLKSPTKKLSISIGLFLGLALATKISALILILHLGIGYVLYLFGNKKKLHSFQTHVPLLLIAITTIIIFFITQPYALIDFQEFLKQTALQSQMSKDPFIFPYTLQYVGKIPYFHELKNIFLYGQGPLISTICLVGIAYAMYLFTKGKKDLLVLFTLFYGISYFLVFGKFAVGWMRYMLPLYPILAVFGGFALLSQSKKIPEKILKHYALRKSLLLGFVILVIVYPVSFLSIYKKPNTRIQASEWIHANIPPGSTIAIEHWDDALPVYGGFNFIHYTLPLYDPDTTQKWAEINQMLSDSQYLILASNRLYIPLQKLTDCNNLPPGKCYPITATYYKELFAGERGFKKVAEFTEYPTVPFFNLRINDQGADESFTVYDHPRIVIFRNESHK